MAKRTVTLYIDDTSLRLLVADGKEVREWAEQALEPGLIKNNVVTAEAEVAERIRQLFISSKVSTKDVIIGTSGLHCFTRPILFPQLPPEMLEEAVRREAKRMLPVSPDQLYLSWQTIPAPEGKTQLFLVGIPRATADSLFKVLRQAGLKPSFMDLKPLLLARLVKEATAIIIDVQASEFDIVILNNGIPQPIRTVPFTEEAAPLAERLNAIKNELNRTITFYNSNNPDKTLAADVPVFASGLLAGETSLCQSLSAELGHPVSALPSVMECPAECDPSRFAANMSLALRNVNVGLALRNVSSLKSTGSSLVSLNVTPVPYRPKPISLFRILSIPSATVAIGLIAFLAILVQNASADVSLVRSQLSDTEQHLKQQIAQRQTKVDGVNKLEKKVNDVQAGVANFGAALGSIEKASNGMNGDLAATLKNLPLNVSLNTMDHDGSTLTLNGVAINENEVLSYLNRLENSGRFGQITVKSMNRIDTGKMSFAIVGSLSKPSGDTSSIETVVLKMPATITLQNITHVEGVITVVAKSPSEDDVMTYLKTLEASHKFDDIAVKSINTVKGEGTNFTLTLKVKGVS